MALRPGDKVVIKILHPDTHADEIRQLIRDGWRLIDVQSDGSGVLLQPRDPEELH